MGSGFVMIVSLWLKVPVKVGGSSTASKLVNGEQRWLINGQLVGKYC